MAFSKQQLHKFADLIRIEIPDEKLEQMNIDSIVGWIDKLQQINTTGAEPMLSPIEQPTMTRSDIVTEQNMRDLILTNTPDNSGTSRGYFAVPKVMDE